LSKPLSVNATLSVNAALAFGLFRACFYRASNQIRAYILGVQV